MLQIDDSNWPEVAEKSGLKIMDTRFVVLFAAAVGLAASGCVVPKRLPEENPFRAEVIGFIEPGTSTKDEITMDELQNLMAGGQELQELSADLGGTV